MHFVNRNSLPIASNDKIYLSIIIPVFNEEESLSELYRRLTKVMEDFGDTYEIIFVNDGCQDNSLQVMLKLQEQDKCVKVIDFSRNFGHQIAITAGMDYASGSAVICLDADLQHPPELIPELVAEWREGNDIVYTIRQETEGETFFKKLTSKFFYMLINKIANVKISSNAADFRLLDRKVVEDFRSIRERGRFVRGLVNWVGYKQIGVTYKAEPRFAGQSKYSFGKMLRFAFDAITAFSSFPLQLSVYLGFVVSFLSFLYVMYIFCETLYFKHTVPGWSSIMVIVLFLGGVQLITIGIIGEYISRIYEEVKERPLYLVRRFIGFE